MCTGLAKALLRNADRQGSRREPARGDRAAQHLAGHRAGHVGGHRSWAGRPPRITTSGSSSCAPPGPAGCWSLVTPPGGWPTTAGLVAGGAGVHLAHRRLPSQPEPGLLPASHEHRRGPELDDWPTRRRPSLASTPGRHRRGPVGTHPPRCCRTAPSRRRPRRRAPDVSTAAGQWTQPSTTLKALAASAPWSLVRADGRARRLVRTRYVSDGGGKLRAASGVARGFHGERHGIWRSAGLALPVRLKLRRGSGAGARAGQHPGRQRGAAAGHHRLLAAWSDRTPWTVVRHQ